MAAALMPMDVTSNAQQANITATAAAMFRQPQIQHGNHHNARLNRIDFMRRQLMAPVTPAREAGDTES